MTEHLSVKEATKLTGKSESTIKRLLREITADSTHDDREFILPAHDDLERLRKAGEPYVWKIDRQLLLKRYPQESQSQQESEDVAKPQSKQTIDSPIIEVLRDQLLPKDSQIKTLETQLDRKDNQIDMLNDRMQETNILMKELQQKLAIAAPAKTAEAATPIDVETTPTLSTDRPSAIEKHLTTFLGFFQLKK